MWGKNLYDAQNFNNTRHDYEITLEPSSIVEPCPDEEAVIPKIQYHVSTQPHSTHLPLPEHGRVLPSVSGCHFSSSETSQGAGAWDAVCTKGGPNIFARRCSRPPQH